MAYYLFALDIVAFLIFLYEWYCAQLVKLDTRLILRSNLSIGSCIRCNTTGVECTESQLCTRLTNSLSSDDTNGFTQLYHTGRCQVTAIALHADTLFALTGENRTNFNTLDRRFINSLCLSLGDFFTRFDNQFTSSWMNNIMHRNTTQNTLIKR